MRNATQFDDDSSSVIATTEIELRDTESSVDISSRRAPGYPIWLWPNLLSLDAPLIAIAWSWMAARSIHTNVNAISLTILGLCVWFIYALDRVLDAALRPELRKSARHRFAFQHGRSLAITCCAVASSTLILCVGALDRAILTRGLWVACAVLFYLGVVHTVRRVGIRIPLKEPAVALIFAAGVLIPLDHWNKLTIPLLIVLAALVWVNTTVIEVCESEYSSASWITSHLGWLSAGASTSLLVLAGRQSQYFGVGLAFLMLGALYRFREHINSEAVRVLADVVLLIPVATKALIG